jgi:hypothetical protein
MIVSVAIKFGPVIAFVPAPGRHHNILHGLHENHGKRTGGYDVEKQGFLTDKGEFLSRREAYDHARSCGQFLKRPEGGYSGTELYSEDLW